MGMDSVTQNTNDETVMCLISWVSTTAKLHRANVSKEADSVSDHPCSVHCDHFYE